MRRQIEERSKEASPVLLYSAPWRAGIGMKPTKLKKEIHVVLKWLIEGNNSSGKISKAHDAE